jgi:hypothetical protein
MLHICKFQAFSPKQTPFIFLIVAKTGELTAAANNPAVCHLIEDWISIPIDLNGYPK